MRNLVVYAVAGVLTASVPIYAQTGGSAGVGGGSSSGSMGSGTGSSSGTMGSDSSSTHGSAMGTPTPGGSMSGHGMHGGSGSGTGTGSGMGSDSGKAGGGSFRIQDSSGNGIPCGIPKRPRCNCLHWRDR